MDLEKLTDVYLSLNNSEKKLFRFKLRFLFKNQIEPIIQKRMYNQHK